MKWLPHTRRLVGLLAGTTMLWLCPAVVQAAPYSVVHAFPMPDPTTNEGSYPAGGVILGSDGALYGTTLAGGTGGANLGTVFRMNRDGSGLTILHSFASATGSVPLSPLVQAGNGALYGTTTEGGPGDGTFYRGVVYSITPSGTYQMLHGFTGPDGSLDASNAALLLGSDGAVYGTSMYGSTSLGEVFRITPGGVYETLHAFTMEGVQGFPSSIIWGPLGLIYGLTVYSTDLTGGGVFSLAPTPEAQPSFLHPFDPISEGGQSRGPLVLGADGALYGTTTLIGDYNTGNVLQTGTIFRLQADGTGFQVVHTFTGGSDGAVPVSLMQGRDGRLFGTTYYGGGSNAGVFFALRSDGTGFEVLHSFEPNTGDYPYGALLETVDGSFYGVTLYDGPRAGGVVYRVSQVTCPGTPMCSGHGTCNDGACACAAGYSGADCSVTCPGGPTCSGHGICSNGTCTCQSGYSGADCSVMTCPGTPVCSGHGTCSNGTCSCARGYSGPSCSVYCAGNSSCPNGTTCNNNNQCGSRVCIGNRCVPPGCTPHCNPGATCGANSDCGSKVCTNSTCAPPACSPNCGPNAVCGNNADCLSRVCSNNVCVPPSCSPRCNQGATCGANSDCGSKICTAGTCRAPACSPNCAAGAACGNNNDCRSRNCSSYVCR